MTVMVAQLAVSGLAAALYLGARGRLVAAFRDSGIAVPAAAAVALSSWFLPLAAAVGLAACGLALALPLKRSRRMTVAAAGLTASAFAVVFAALTAFVPLLG